MPAQLITVSMTKISQETLLSPSSNRFYCQVKAWVQLITHLSSHEQSLGGYTQAVKLCRAEGEQPNKRICFGYIEVTFDFPNDLSVLVSVVHSISKTEPY